MSDLLDGPEIRLKNDIVRQLRGEPDILRDDGEARLINRAAEKATSLAHMLDLPLLDIKQAEIENPTGIFEDFAEKSRDLGMLLGVLQPRTSPLAEGILERAQTMLTQLGVPAE